MLDRIRGLRSVVVVAACLMASLLSAPAQAGDAMAPHEAALLASQILEDYCIDTTAQDPEERAAAVSAAAPAFGKVAEAYRVHGDAYLLY